MTEKNESLVDDINLEEETPEELTDDEKSESADLYNDFSSFMEKKMEIVPDKGERIFLPTGIQILDAALGGGFPVGSFSMITGNPGAGKTMLATKVIAASQIVLAARLMAAFLDSEEAMTKKRLAQLGVRNPKIDPYNNLTVEKVFKFIEGMVLFKIAKEIDVPSLLIWDSIANTLSEKEFEVDDINSVIGYRARLLSALIPKALTKCAQHKIAIIAINQLRDKVKIGKFDAPNELKFITQDKKIPGGNSIKFNAFHLLEMKIRKALDPTKWGFDGIVVKVKAVKNKEFTPNIELDIVGSFTTGFSNFWTNYRFLRDNKRMETGAWNKLINLPEKRFRTKDAKSLYNTDKEFKAAFDEAVEDTIQKEIIEKYTDDA